MKIKCKGCKESIFVCTVVPFKHKDFFCYICKCKMYIDTVDGGYFVLGRENDPFEDILDGNGSAMVENVVLSKTDNAAIPFIPNGTDLNTIETSENSVYFLRKMLLQAEVEERYEDCAVIMSRIKRIIDNG